MNADGYNQDLADPLGLGCQEHLEDLLAPLDLPVPEDRRGLAGNSYNRNSAPCPCGHTLWTGGVCTNYHRIVNHTFYHQSHCICSIETLLKLNLYFILCDFDMI